MAILLLQAPKVMNGHEEDFTNEVFIYISPSA